MSILVQQLKWSRLGNVPLSRVTLEETLVWIAARRRDLPFRLIVTPNVDHIIRLQRDAAFRAAYAGAALSLADGVPVVWAARFLGLGGVEKVSGSDLVPALCARGAAEGWRVFFIGGRSPEEMELCLERLRARYPGLQAAGIFAPFGFELSEAESERIIAAALEHRAEVILHGCGAPKSEIWMARHAAALGRGVGIGIGAGLRFVAGLERRAPVWMQRVGLEWLWRMAHEPRRLVKRYLIDDMRFFPLVLGWKRRGEFGPLERKAPGEEPRDGD